MLKRLNNTISNIYNYMGGGILPVAMHKNQLFFLFGKENSSADTPGWSDFGGGKEGRERPITTAVREGYEELSGFLGSKSQVNMQVKNNLICSVESNRYTTFIFKADYCEMLPVYFNRNFKFMQKHAPHILSKNGLYEKSEIKWFTANEIMQNRSQFRNYYDKEFLDSILAEEKNIKKALRN